MASPRPRRAAAVFFLLAMLTACAGIPTSGPVQEGSALQLQPENEGVPFIAEPPTRGASPEDIVRGFLRASADFRGDHEVARLYLAPASRQRWNPGTLTTVYDRSSLTVDRNDEGAVVVRGTETARIDSEGIYRASAGDAVVERVLPVERVDGQWRIASMANGLLLSTVDVRETFRQLALYFLSPSRNTLVPELVLLPQLPGLTTKLVSRLLRGPTAALRGAVETAFPQGTGLEVASVPVREGVASVRLDQTALKGDDKAREQMSAQIVWTLKQLGPEIARIRITAGGEDLVTSGVRPEQPRDSWPTFDPDALPGDPSLYVVRAGSVGRVIDERFEQVPGAAGRAGAGLRTPAVSLDSGRIAAVSQDGRNLVEGNLGADAPLDVVAKGGDLAAPSWGPLGDLWFTDRESGHLFVLPDGGTRPVAVGLPKLPGGATVTELAVSYDGSRIALVTGRGGRARAVVGALSGVDALDGDDTPEGAVAVIAVRELAPDLRGVRDVGWADAMRVVVLGSRDDLPVQPVYLTLDGFEAVEVPPLEDGVSVAAIPPQRPQTAPLVTATSKGRLFAFTSGPGWVPLAQGSDPAYPG